MPSWSRTRRMLPPAVLGSVATTAGAFATNELTAHGPVWWWAVLAVSGVGVVAAGVWAYWVQMHPDEDPRPQPAKTTHQTAGDGGTNVSISADNNSVAAWHVDTLNMGKPPNGGSGS